MFADTKLYLVCFFFMMIANEARAKPEDIHIHIHGLGKTNGQTDKPSPNRQNKVYFQNRIFQTGTYQNHREIAMFRKFPKYVIPSFKISMGGRGLK